MLGEEQGYLHSLQESPHKFLAHYKGTNSGKPSGDHLNQWTQVNITNVGTSQPHLVPDKMLQKDRASSM